MSQLQALKSARSLHDLADLLQFTPKAITYILYKLSAEAKYRAFDIPKRSGGVRHINAPCDQLMLLQRRLSDLLQNCVEEINVNHNWPDQLAHGFKRNRSIITNAKKHKGRRFVFNVDIENFFGTINFGRVRGFFIKNADFFLDQSVATIMAQIACHENALPQGSPCSPVISNLIGSVLDTHLCSLANEFGCTYSRYADDITFSTNRGDFPSEIAKQSKNAPHTWEVGIGLRDVIAHAGFALNPTKTRMQYRTSRQDVTGLVVNKKVNIRSEYRNRVRAMANRLFRTGKYQHITLVQKDGVLASAEIDGSLAQLHGMLGHIWGIDLHNWKIGCGLKTADPVEDASKEDQKVLISKERLYRRFLIYRNIYAAELPTIICEGKTDNVYLSHAIRALAASFPSLVETKDNQVKIAVRIFKYPQTSTGRIMGLTGGTGSFVSFIPAYSKELTRFSASGMRHPVILLMDRDDGASSVLGMIKKQFKKDTDADQPYIHVCGNLYVVTTPVPAGKKSSLIEDCFKDETKAVTIEGKTFKIDKAHEDNENYYGKFIFAKYVEAHAANIDFSGFTDLLTRIAAVIEAHKSYLFIPNADEEQPAPEKADAAAG